MLLPNWSCRWAHRLHVQLIVLAIAVFGYNEYAVYYLQIAQCSWPALNHTTGSSSSSPPPPTPAQRPVRALILADIHMLGPAHGHWFDRLRREWQMHRAFQTALQLQRPDAVFLLGDLFDEGQTVDAAAFADYVQRYRRLFHVPAGVRVFGALGNHDVGFHYRMRPALIERFERAKVFRNAAEKATLVDLGGVSFVLLNSMAMHGDGCLLCSETERQVRSIAQRLDCRRPGRADSSAVCANRTAAERRRQYRAPILLQHFPTWRASDAVCSERDESLPADAFRERWEALSESATRWLGEVLRPRAVFGGHSHRWCRTRTLWGADEWTVNSFSWRNNDDPRFLMAVFGGGGGEAEEEGQVEVRVCEMPLESTVLRVYAVGALVAVGLVLRAAVEQMWRRWGGAGQLRGCYEKVK